MNSPKSPATTTQDQEVGSGYDVVRARLTTQAAALVECAQRLNQRRKETFGSTEMSIIGNERVRTENNCVPCDVTMVDGHLLFGYNVFIGLRTETTVADVFGLHRFVVTPEGIDVSSAAGDNSRLYHQLFGSAKFNEHCSELYRYYKHAKLTRLWRSELHLLAVFRIGQAQSDTRVFRWGFQTDGSIVYVDNRGERDLALPPPHDFEWREVTREQHVRGKHPHVSIGDRIFVETVGGDLTVKVENNTSTGQGIFSEAVTEPNQTLDDAQFFYQDLGSLIVVKALPYRENTWRHLVYVARSNQVLRIDAIGGSCVQLPEDHGIVFPGGFVLQDGTYKLFDGDYSGFRYEKAIFSPNGEDVLYIFHEPDEGRYALFSYNLIRKEVGAPLLCHGYGLFNDGRLGIFRIASAEPVRVHPFQFWQTPFQSAELHAKHEAENANLRGPLAKVGNPELVRGISDLLGLSRLIGNQRPSRELYEDILRAISKTQDSYFWLNEEALEQPGVYLDQLRQTTSLVIDEFEKVSAIREQSAKELAKAREDLEQVFTNVARLSTTKQATAKMEGLHLLRRLRGQLIALHDHRYIDRAAVEHLEKQAIERFDAASREAADFLLSPDALAPITSEVDQLVAGASAASTVHALAPLLEKLTNVGQGMSLLSEMMATLKVEDPTQRTQIIERLSDVYGHVNRGRATLEGRRRSLMLVEAKSEFAAQFALLSQSVANEIAAATTPDACDDGLARVLIALEELDSRFGEFDEFIGELTNKREDVREAFAGVKQRLLDERQLRAEKLAAAGNRILESVARRCATLRDEADLQAFFATDAMITKLGQVTEQLDQLQDSVRAEELRSRKKSIAQESLRALRDRNELYVGEGKLLRLGNHEFAVQHQDLTLGLSATEGKLHATLAGTDFRLPIDDPTLLELADYWGFALSSENDDVSRSEYLAASIYFDAVAGKDGRSIAGLREAQRESEGLLAITKAAAASRYDEGYERGCHDHDAAAILGALLDLSQTAGPLRFRSRARSLAQIAWTMLIPEESRLKIQLRLRSLQRLHLASGATKGFESLGLEIGDEVSARCEAAKLPVTASLGKEAGQYLVEELLQTPAGFRVARPIMQRVQAFVEAIEIKGSQDHLHEELAALSDQLALQLELISQWIAGIVDGTDNRDSSEETNFQCACIWRCIQSGGQFHAYQGALQSEVSGLLARHRNIREQSLVVDLPEFLARLSEFTSSWTVEHRRFRARKHEVLESLHHELRLSEFEPKVFSSFVRNRLIDEVYLPLIGTNLAKQLGAAGEHKRTDLMGMLLLISPPGYGKTTLMEYVAARLGLLFIKVNAPSLGHDVHSLDPAQAPNATARQEVEKINLAFELGNNVMLYIDDIQHTHPEFLQKFISLCDGQRKIDGVYRGRARTYDLRGKKFCVVMAGNPYTETGERFRIPDMLANRADTYNLGDILAGTEDVFSMSYLENAMTSNRVLSPLAGRGKADIHRFIDLARGIEIPSAEFEHSYSAAEAEEIIAVLRHLLEIQKTVLAVNQAYIESAGVDDAYRTSPPFKLQGSYRNMNKLAEKVVAAMTPQERESLIDDHYTGEAQTLTQGTQTNLLRLSQLRGRWRAGEEERWHTICEEFRRRNRLGAAGDGPGAQIASELSHLGQRVDDVSAALRSGQKLGEGLTPLTDELRTLQKVVAEVATRQAAVPAKTQSNADNVLPMLEVRLHKLELSLAALDRKLKEPSSHAGTATAADNASFAGHLQAIHESVGQIAKSPVRITVTTPPALQDALKQQVRLIEDAVLPMIADTTLRMHETRELGQSLRELVEHVKQLVETRNG